MIKIKILIISDLQGVSKKTIDSIVNIDKRKFDLIVSLGDITNNYLKIIGDSFNDKPFFGILGNHDIIGQLKGMNILDLGNKTVDYNGISFAGVEGCIRYKRSDFNPMYSQDQIKEMTSELPKTDIVLSHNSPFGIHDKNYDSHAGYEGLINYINKYSPLYCIHGHQHINKITKYNDTYVIGVYGASILNTETNVIENIVLG